MKIKEWLADPAHWCRGALGMLDGRHCINLEIADQTCLMGAIGKCYGVGVWDIDADNPIYRQISAEIMAITGRSSLAKFNDTHSHAEVLELVTRLNI